MKLSKINTFVKLGVSLKEYLLHENKQILLKAEQQNAWFTQKNLYFAISEIAKLLNKNKLLEWIEKYPLAQNKDPKTVALILSGNIPLVGFHDLLCVLMSGHKALIKLSHKDQTLYHLIYDLLVKIDPTYKNFILFTKQTIEKVDAIIATGSNNSARYFDYYFSKYPHIIRKNRNSLAILSSDNSMNELEQLADDLFLYFGLGCRNISFLFLPENFDFTYFFEGIEKYKDIINHQKYANNYLYQQTILTMNRVPFYDNGFCLFTQHYSLHSPIGVIHYAYYKKEEEIIDFITQNKKAIQCIVSNKKHSFKTFPFGEAQKPTLNDYADNVDTLSFLLKI